MLNAIEIKGDTLCEYCGSLYFHDQGQRCQKCDVLVCRFCIVEGSERLCLNCHHRSFPDKIKPMLPVTNDLPDDPSQWSSELIWDGQRSLLFWNNAYFRLESRELLNITARFPELRAAAERSFDSAGVILDGVICVSDDSGRPGLIPLMPRIHAPLSQVMKLAWEYPVRYVVFDILFYNDQWVTHLPQMERRKILERLRLRDPRMILSPMIVGDSRPLLDLARKKGLQGIIMKHVGGAYEAGCRSDNWRKIRVANTQQFLVGGWTADKNDPSRIGALLLGFYNDMHLLQYAGSVRAGIEDGSHRILFEKLSRLHRPVSPFSSEVPDMQSSMYAVPRLVAQVEYRRWPRGGLLQQPQFKGLKSDKPPLEVTDKENR